MPLIDFEDGKDYRVAVDDSLKGHELLLKKYSDEDMHNILAYLETAALLRSYRKLSTG